MRVNVNNLIADRSRVGGWRCSVKMQNPDSVAQQGRLPNQLCTQSLINCHARWHKTLPIQLGTSSEKNAEWLPLYSLLGSIKHDFYSFLHHQHKVTFLQRHKMGIVAKQTIIFMASQPLNGKNVNLTCLKWIVHINHLSERLMLILNYERCGVSGKKAIDFSYDTPCTKAEYFGMFHGQVTVDLIWANS